MVPDMTKMDSLKVFEADQIDFSNSRYTAHENESWREFITGWVSKLRINPQLSLTSLPCNITRLSLVNCNLHDNAFPKDFGVAGLLKYLDLIYNPIRFLPDCFKRLKRHKILELKECIQLQTLEDLPDIKWFEVMGCRILEKITFKRCTYWKSFVYPVRGLSPMAVEPIEVAHIP
ncbi:hypothetical protein POM88_034144 [Heracleum sosnowskyi]|uniref:Uncharacterized protein n=1 Tax=Heracleum sosnowskyi TaxID=360622 RepID=A0AAD8HKU8_9APIA|nr:hypothetical protein POM88_034144 [Heracleum sosnowskyi]